MLVAEFDQKRTVKAHRAAQRAVNLLPNAQQVKEDKKILQERIDSILKQKLVK
ncbi:fibrinogen-binding protein [Staphylococcus aureus]|uniref:fibrinogen-binding protein n=1 Tax=Staphylococcus aureus TaxID=1280 RepID=UPI001CD0E095